MHHRAYLTMCGFFVQQRIYQFNFLRCTRVTRRWGNTGFENYTKSLKILMSPSMNVFNNQISDFSSFMIKQQFDNLFVSIKASVQNQSHSKIVFDIQFNIFTKIRRFQRFSNCGAWTRKKLNLQALNTYLEAWIQRLGRKEWTTQTL